MDKFGCLRFIHNLSPCHPNFLHIFAVVVHNPCHPQATTRKWQGSLNYILVITQLWANLWITFPSGGRPSAKSQKSPELPLPCLSTPLSTAPSPLAVSLPPAVFDDLCEFLNLVVRVSLFGHFFANLAVGVHHGGVVFTTEVISDFW